MDKCWFLWVIIDFLRATEQNAKNIYNAKKLNIDDVELIFFFLNYMVGI